eukprot:CAMPEP_0182825436 /NCGR_PEP_ID=MMETSP0006_2-20121128/15834_1 /TAXON_ID=97485 /ORGANISM="Prymnesium parvum, Strain Texoma1" /LENGTH=50 /DNA_ID=CAMNT_0024952523 /DNA_START=818 /DNA_END=967 /DNA_ORIENTATION=-
MEPGEAALEVHIESRICTVPAEDNDDNEAAVHELQTMFLTESNKSRKMAQ